jgi:hypothetical protein
MAATIDTVTTALKLPRKAAVDEVFTMELHPARK